MSLIGFWWFQPWIDVMRVRVPVMEWVACYYSSSRPSLCTLSLVIHCSSSASACHVNQPGSWSGLSPSKPAITSSPCRSWRHPMIVALLAPVACVLWLCCLRSLLITVLRLISKRNTTHAWVIGHLGKKRRRGFNILWLSQNLMTGHLCFGNISVFPFSHIAAIYIFICI